uniref:RNA-directed DNA polymerase n=1 Tax=Lactuca sativa TaxID=4236 RepID=A0A9R1UKT8_LACSA|nr:hypothetical protein LSAT_V11C900505850 [Lactuca sativa]
MTSIPELNRSTTSIPELNRSINLLNEKINGLIINLDLTVNKYITITQLEVASAKIIADITKELAEKINSCPCNKDILEHIKNISIIEQKTKPGKYSGLKKYSPPNPSTVKFEYSDMEDDEAESSYTATRRGNKKKCEFQMPVHNGIPNSGQGPNTINILNIDYIQDLKLRERVVEKWVTEISLILQTNPDEFEKAKNVLLLLEHKTDGIVQKFLRNNNWNEELHGSDLFDNLINVIYTTFLGLDYISNKDFTINKKVDIARVSMTKLQLHGITLLDKYTCMFESYLYDIPQRSEYAQWISAYLMKIPIIGETCTDRWKKEATREIQQTSLSYATKIAKEEIDRICQDRYKQQNLKTISKDCCSILSDFKNFDIGKKNYTKKKRKFSPGKYFKKPSKETPKKTTSCPQGKKKCRCWICSEEGHYANECPNRKNTLTKSRFYKPLTMEAMKLLKKSMMVYNMFLYIMLRQNLHQTLKNTNQQRMTQTSPIQTPLSREEEINHFCANLQKIDDSLIMNLTNPNSIYVSAFLNFKGYKKFRVHCFVDTGASLCLASKFIIPDELWENAPKEISATIANGETIKINKVTEAYSKGKPGFLETQEKGSKEKQIPGTDITHDGINKERIISIQTTRFKQIEDLLEKVCSENPIDPNKTKGWMQASIKLIDPKTVIREKPTVYSLQDREEFSKQIKELLDMRLIIESKFPHMSPAFLVNKEAEKRRGKKRMVVNHKAINDANIGDSHNLPNMHELLTLLRGKNIYSSFDCKSGFWHVVLYEESQLLTAFTCHDGLFQWKVLPFGLKQAPSIFQRHMQNAL